MNVPDFHSFQQQNIGILLFFFSTEFVRNQSMFGHIFVSSIDKFTKHIEIVVMFDLI